MSATPVLISEIEEIIDRYVRPFLHQHQGDIEIKSVEDGILYVELKGACGDCPYSMETLKNGVENIISFYFSDIKEVRAI